MEKERSMREKRKEEERGGRKQEEKAEKKRERKKVTSFLPTSVAHIVGHWMFSCYSFYPNPKFTFAMFSFIISVLFLPFPWDLSGKRKKEQERKKGRKKEKEREERQTEKYVRRKPIILLPPKHKFINRNRKMIGGLFEGRNTATTRKRERRRKRKKGEGEGKGIKKRIEKGKKKDETIRKRKGRNDEEEK